MRDEIDSMKAERAELQKQQQAKKYQDTTVRLSSLTKIKNFVDNTG